MVVSDASLPPQEPATDDFAHPDADGSCRANNHPSYMPQNPRFSNTKVML